MTTTDIFHKQYPLALEALALHMTRHHLAAPTSVDTIEHHGFGQTPVRRVIRLRLPVFADQQAAWLDSVVVDAEDVEVVTFGVRVTWSVRLPDTGFCFELVGLRPHPLHAVVPA